MSTYLEGIIKVDIWDILLVAGFYTSQMHVNRVVMNYVDIVRRHF
jgi:hypothetical protein